MERDNSGNNRRAARRFVPAACALLGVLVGVGVFVIPHAVSVHDASLPYRVDREHSDVAFPAGVGGVDANAGVFVRNVEPAFAARTPEAAVRYFLDARIAGRAVDAWRAVSDEDHRQYPEASDWIAANGSLPTVTSYTLGPTRIAGNRADLTGTIDQMADLDRVRGLVPAHERATWVVVREDGDWHVSLANSVLTPVYPPADRAPVPAREWATALQQRCTTAVDSQQPLVGDAADATASQLCDRPGALTFAPVHELVDNNDAESFIAAFGGDVFTWARVVPLRAPVSFDIVLAPVGDQWSVIGAIEASPLGSG
jgi:hypothetical protein